MRTIKNDPNLQLSETIEAYRPSSSTEQRKAQEEARTTVIDASEMVPQFEGKGYGAINTKMPNVTVLTEASSNAISGSQTI